MGTRVRNLWCVLVLNQATGEPRLPWVLNSFGNGKEHQYPIFPTRSEARSWANGLAKAYRFRIVRCAVSFDSPGFGVSA